MGQTKVDIFNCKSRKNLIHAKDFVVVGESDVSHDNL